MASHLTDDVSITLNRLVNNCYIDIRLVLLEICRGGQIDPQPREKTYYCLKKLVLEVANFTEFNIE